MRRNKAIYLIDTNIFLRALVKENKKSFDDCVRFLDFVRGGEIIAVTSTLVLAEVNWVLEGFYKFSKRDATDALNGIVSLKHLRVQDSFDASLGVWFYSENKVKFIDAMLAAHIVVQEHDAVIVSYDKDFDKLGVQRVEPRNI